MNAGLSRLPAYLLPFAGIAVVFFILPAFCPDRLGLFLLLIVNSAACLLASVLFGIFAGISRGVIAMPVVCGVFFVLSAVFYYSGAELVYLAVYLGMSVLGIGIGWLLSHRGPGV